MSFFLCLDTIGITPPQTDSSTTMTTSDFITSSISHDLTTQIEYFGDLSETSQNENLNRIQTSTPNEPLADSSFSGNPTLEQGVTTPPTTGMTHHDDSHSTQTSDIMFSPTLFLKEVTKPLSHEQHIQTYPYPTDGIPTESFTEDVSTTTIRTIQPKLHSSGELHGQIKYHDAEQEGHLIITFLVFLCINALILVRICLIFNINI